MIQERFLVRTPERKMTNWKLNTGWIDISIFHDSGKVSCTCFCMIFRQTQVDYNEQEISGLIQMKLCWQSPDLHKIEPRFVPHEIWRHIFIRIIKFHWSGCLVTRRGWLFIVLCSFFSKHVPLTTCHQKLEIISWKWRQEISNLTRIRMYSVKLLSCWRLFRTM